MVGRATQRDRLRAVFLLGNYPSVEFVHEAKGLGAARNQTPQSLPFEKRTQVPHLRLATALLAHAKGPDLKRVTIAQSAAALAAIQSIPLLQAACAAPCCGSRRQGCTGYMSRVSRGV